jgi:hypothetical protein
MRKKIAESTPYYVAGNLAYLVFACLLQKQMC